MSTWPAGDEPPAKDGKRTDRGRTANGRVGHGYIIHQSVHAGQAVWQSNIVHIDAGVHFSDAHSLFFGSEQLARNFKIEHFRALVVIQEYSFFICFLLASSIGVTFRGRKLSRWEVVIIQQKKAGYSANAVQPENPTAS